MRYRATTPLALVVFVALVLAGGQSIAATVWSGPEVGFLKLGTDPLTVEDVLNADVSLTRGASGFLFNPRGGDTGPTGGAPSGTRWAFDTLIGNPDGVEFAAANHAHLQFLPFLDAVGGTNGTGGAGVPNVVLAHPGVLHLVTADVYLDIRFLQWTSPFQIPASAVEYVRSSPVPVPAAWLLLGSAALALVRRARRPARCCKPRSSDLLRSIAMPRPDHATIARYGSASLVLALLTGTVLSNPVHALDDPIPVPIAKGPIRIELESIASGVTSPNFLTHAGDASGRLFFLEQPGRVRVIEDGIVRATPFLDVSTRLPALGMFGLDFDERGLLGAAFHPDYANNGRFYTFTSEVLDGPADFSVTLPVGANFDHQSVITEWQVSTSDPNVIDPTSRRELMRIDNPQFNHNSGMLAFGPDGYLYASIGDGGNADDFGPGHSFPQGNGQDPGNVLGSMLRIDVEGSNSANGRYGIPLDNPFVAVENDPGDTIPDEVYATGFRNVFRFSFDSASGTLVAADVGQGNIEEVSLVVAGGNFGWNLKEGSFRFDPNTGEVSVDPGGQLTDPLIDPVLEYDHDEGISIIGGFVYRGDAIPELDGKYVFGDFSNQGFRTPGGRLFYGDLDTGLIHEFTLGLDDRELGLFVKGFGEDAEGELYLLADLGLGANSTQGEIFRLVAAPVPLPAAAWLLTPVATLLLARRRLAG
ncbi:MAG: PQQ-dependent sugar dehydrogenase [Gammaproteobacteria bacterium]